MHSLLQFFSRYGNALLFLLLEALSLFLLFGGSDFHQSVAFTSANRINGALYRFRSQLTHYIGLREQNTLLWQQNSELEKQLFQMEESMRRQSFEQQELKPSLDYTYIYAKVIKNSTTQLENYLTIDAGVADGVEPGMGVVSPLGIVGVVRSCSEHFSLVTSVLNAQARFSCKTLPGHVVGSLIWQGGDTRYAWLAEMPGYQFWNQGDTVVTSGFSDSFPAGIPVGTVEASQKQQNDNFYSCKVQLFTHFESLADVRLIRRTLAAEQDSLEREVLP